jgi:hypothetical protein
MDDNPNLQRAAVFRCPKQARFVVMNEGNCAGWLFPSSPREPRRQHSPRGHRQQSHTFNARTQFSSIKHLHCTSWRKGNLFFSIQIDYEKLPRTELNPVSSQQDREKLQRTELNSVSSQQDWEKLQRTELNSAPSQQDREKLQHTELNSVSGQQDWEKLQCTELNSVSSQQYYEKQLCITQ